MATDIQGIEARTTGGIMRFEVLEPEAARWAELFDGLPREAQDVFYTPGFAQLCQKTIDTGYLVRCAAGTCLDGSVLLYPFVQRPIGGMVDIPVAAEMQDSISLYGRGGVVGMASKESLAAFHDELADYMRLNRVICSFDRLHPLMSNEKFSSPASAIRDVGGFVIVDLALTLEELEASFKPSVRKDIRKAQRNGVLCMSESSSDHIDEFLDIYYQTMERNSASDFYFFPKEFFTALASHLPGMFSFFYAEHDQRIVSCELVLHCGDYSHSFLGGTRRDALPLAANPLLKFEICKTMKAKGSRYFLLGGGQAADDGIFNFKKAYAPEGVYSSRICGTIWDSSAYNQLQQAMIVAGLPVAPNRFQYYEI